MSAQYLILAAAAGAVSLAICAVLWALVQRRQAQARLDALAAKLAGLELRAEAHASAAKSGLSSRR